MTTFQAGDVILVSFPFADQEKRKKRPALVVADTGDRDLIVARITTQYCGDEFNIAVVDWKDAGLLAASFVRVNKLATLEKNLVLQRLGTLRPEDLSHVNDGLRKLFDHQR